VLDIPRVANVSEERIDHFEPSAVIPQHTFKGYKLGHSPACRGRRSARDETHHPPIPDEKVGHHSSRVKATFRHLPISGRVIFVTISPKPKRRI
jgi:hypothetical protein